VFKGLKQLSDVSALLATTHLLRWHAKRPEHAKTSNMEYRYKFL